MTITIIIIFGLIIGSFLNVCIWRLPRQISVSHPSRSFCPHCETQLTWLENIPVLSWLYLGAKCRTCKSLISGQYPFVEILSAGFALTSYHQYGLTPTGVLIYLLTAALIVITFIDLEFKIIPDLISFPGMIIGLLLSVISQFAPHYGYQIFHEPIAKNSMESLMGLFAGGGFFYVVGWGYYLFTKRIGLGGGDIKLMGMVGALLGWRGAFETILTGSLLGAFVGIIVMIFSGKGRHTEIPFGPFLALGTVVFLFSGLKMFPTLPM